MSPSRPSLQQERVDAKIQLKQFYEDFAQPYFFSAFSAAPADALDNPGKIYAKYLTSLDNSSNPQEVVAAYRKEYFNDHAKLIKGESDRLNRLNMEEGVYRDENAIKKAKMTIETRTRLFESAFPGGKLENFSAENLNKTANAIKNNVEANKPKVPILNNKEIFEQTIIVPKPKQPNQPEIKSNNSPKDDLLSSGRVNINNYANNNNDDLLSSRRVNNINNNNVSNNNDDLLSSRQVNNINNNNDDFLSSNNNFNNNNNNNNNNINLDEQDPTKSMSPPRRNSNKTPNFTSTNLIENAFSKQNPNIKPEVQTKDLYAAEIAAEEAKAAAIAEKNAKLHAKSKVIQEEKSQAEKQVQEQVSKAKEILTTWEKALQGIRYPSGDNNILKNFKSIITSMRALQECPRARVIDENIKAKFSSLCEQTLKCVKDNPKFFKDNAALAGEFVQTLQATMNVGKNNNANNDVENNKPRRFNTGI